MNYRQYLHCGFKRVAAISPNVCPADPETNTATIIKILSSPSLQLHDIILFPELSITGYTCADLFLQPLLIRKAEECVRKILEGNYDLNSSEYRNSYYPAELPTGLSDERLVAVGAPVAHRGKLYNCAILICNSRIVAIVPKTHIPNYGEYYERRWFESAEQLQQTEIQYAGCDGIPFGTDIAISFHGMNIAAEICEDLWTPIPPSCHTSMAGADVILNLSASNESLGKSHYRRELILQQSARCRSVYIYASAGKGESSTDLSFPGYAAIAENGTLLCENSPFDNNYSKIPHDLKDFVNHFASADIDPGRLQSERLKFNTFCDNPAAPEIGRVRMIKIPEGLYHDIRADEDAEIKITTKEIDPLPFVPADYHHRNENCIEIINIQCHGLLQRIQAIGCSRLVIGVSGGLDSTLALLIAARTLKMAGIPTSNIFAITMPGLATTGRTRSNAWQLMELLGCTSLEVPIGTAVDQHFKDIGQDPGVYDATFENSQARERTQILMDYANKAGGIVVGTGDLSELALGWCTYNGDHMSMYAVNSSVPKTLVKYLVQWFADDAEDYRTRDILTDIIDTPISPELVPSGNDNDEIAQRTEDLVGPYDLHDFFLFHMLRNAFEPIKIFILACEAFKGRFTPEVILKWERTFYRRFFNQQFKRSCMPDGPKVGSVCLSPRGDWRMPSDATAHLWLEQLEEIFSERVP